jgi:transposase InsO family protein
MSWDIVHAQQVKTKNQAIITAVVQGSMSIKAAAGHFEVSERWVKELLRRYRYEGEAAYHPRSKRPNTSPNATPAHIRARVVALRQDLTAKGLDAGAETIQAHLLAEGLHAPAKATIHRILRAAGLVTDQPQKRPIASLIRFEAAFPNQMWQADFTHWRLADATDTEILDFLDDHSRMLISIQAYRRVTSPDVAHQFTDACQQHGRPRTMLTDNGLVFTTRFIHRDQPAKNAFEKLLQRWDIQQINGSPNHPQTQGKIERFHRTLKLWLTAQPPAETLDELNDQLVAFQCLYNEQRPHRAIGRRTPLAAYTALPKLGPVALPQEEYRIRTDTVDQFGKLTLRYDGKLRHLGMGVAHRHVKVRMLIDNTEVIVINRKTGEILKYFSIDPTKNYQIAAPWPELPED